MRVIFSKPSRTALKISRKKFRDLLSRAAVLIKLRASSTQKISVAFVSLSKIAKINEEFVGHKGITDVVSFDYRDTNTLNDSDAVIVELIISYEKAFFESQRRKNVSFAGELTLYIVHGLLHINGFNDLTPEDRRKMRRAERAIMSVLKTEFDLSGIFWLNFLPKTRKVVL